MEGDDSSISIDQLDLFSKVETELKVTKLDPTTNEVTFRAFVRPTPRHHDRITVPDAARLLGVHKQTVGNWINEGRFSTVLRLGPRKTFLKRAEVERMARAWS